MAIVGRGWVVVVVVGGGGRRNVEERCVCVCVCVCVGGSFSLRCKDQPSLLSALAGTLS